MERDEILLRFTLNDTTKITNAGEEIGRGAYGRVFKVHYYGTLCAAKEIHSILLENVSRQELERTKTTYLHECRQCCALRHPNIVQFLGLYYPPSTSGVGNQGNKLPTIVMELMQQSLRSYVESAEKSNTTIPYVSKLSILQDVAQGLMYLHHQNPPIVHRDLSPNNILLNAHLVAKISDLGVAKAIKLDNKSTMTKVPGTSDFMPTEALQENSKYGPSLDIFSYGGITLFLISQQWPDLLPIKQFDQKLNKLVFLTEIERRQSYITKLTEVAKELEPLILSCLDENPVARPTTTDILDKLKELQSKISPKDQIKCFVCAKIKPNTNDSSYSFCPAHAQRVADLLDHDSQALHSPTANLTALINQSSIQDDFNQSTVSYKNQQSFDPDQTANQCSDQQNWISSLSYQHSNYEQQPHYQPPQPTEGSNQGYGRAASYPPQAGGDRKGMGGQQVPSQKPPIISRKDSDATKKVPKLTMAQQVIQRTFATPDNQIVQRASQDLRNDYKKNFARGGTVHFETFPAFTVCYPSINASHYPPGFVEYVADNLTDRYAKDTLEKDFTCLNSLKESTPLIPLYTTGDGNCLLHAASLAMWGFEDKQFILRNALYESLTTADSNTNTLQDRCRRTIAIMLSNVQVHMTDNDWQLEWQQIVNQARSNSGRYQSLEESHIFVLANILRRPIIVYGAPKVRSFNTGGTMMNINFRGIYLPLLWGSQISHKPPLCLGYGNGHFTALVPAGNPQQHIVIPLTDNMGYPLPMHFLLQAEEKNTFYLLEQYLDVIQIYCASLNRQIVVAVVALREATHMPQLVQGYLDTSLTEFHKKNQSYYAQPQPAAMPQGEIQRQPCVGCDTGAYGSPETNFLCSVCYKKQTTAAASYNPSHTVKTRL